jgi:CheY-like chemotaxis protein
MVGDRDKAIQAGCNDYATKPVEFEKLVGLINRLIGV